MSDSIKWKILEDGTVSIETDAISGENHLSADQLLESLADILSGSVDIESKRRSSNALLRSTNNERRV